MTDESSPNAADDTPDPTADQHESGAADGRTVGQLDEDEFDATVNEAQAAIADARRRLAEVPADVVVTNHAMGLYELAAIHLSSAPPRLADASLAIDALSYLVDGLGDRIGENAPLLRDALGNIRMAFVQVKSGSAEPPAGASTDPA